jgi:hypothetical protein
MRRIRGLALGSLLVVACGGSKPPVDAPATSAEKPAAASASAADPPAAEPDAKASAPSSGLPKECAKKGATCVPPKKFVEKLCSGSFPSVALYLFGNKSPWARGYLKGRTKAWNASGGASDNSWLEFDEEVLVLAERKADLGGMQVSGGGGASYDALRWDGGCVTLSGDEMTLEKPPAPKNSRVEWRFLDDNVQAALRADSAVNDAYLARRKECKGATSGEVSSKCVKADDRLSAEIVKFVRSGGPVPEPTKVP